MTHDATRMMASTTPTKWACLVGVVVLAAALRWVSLEGTTVDRPIRADAREYVAYAYNMKYYGVYSRDVTWRTASASESQPDAHRPPGYPIMLALFLDGPPDSRFEMRVRIAQAVGGVITVIIGIAVGCLLLSFGWGIAVGLLLALMPQLIIYESYLLTESLFALLAALMALLVALFFKSNSGGGRMATAVAFGCVLGLSLLLRPTLYYLPLIMLVATLAVPAFRRFRSPAMLVLLTSALMFSPWAIRNLTQFGYLSDPALARGTLLGGSYPDFLIEDNPESFGRPMSYDPRSREIMASTRSVVAEVGHKFAEAPGTMLRWYTIGKPYYFFSMNEVTGWGWVFIYPVLESPFLSVPWVRALSSVMSGLHWPLVVLTLAGLLLVWWPGGRLGIEREKLAALRLLSLLFAFVVAIHLVGTPLPRYAVPFRPWSLVLAMFALALLVQWLRRVQQQSRTAHVLRKRR
ncbi:MAG TPA: glycosyltransferase family 39 protein [Xanthomonadaceae bacterium]|nr:glycosyltransferase family 39 protein [Xanthomonadaceae bacterium]